MKHMIGTKTSALRRAVALCMVLICLCGCALPLLTSCKEISGKVTTLYVYNWGEYISDGSEDSLDSNAAFEEWYYETFGEHVRVNYSTRICMPSSPPGLFPTTWSCRRII